MAPLPGRDPDYSSKNHVIKFLRALPLKWRAKVTTIEEANDLATLPLDKLIGNLKVYEMVLDNDDVASKTTKEKVKSLALKTKVTREQTSEDNDSQGGSDEDVDEEEDEAFNLMTRNFRKFFRKDIIDLQKENEELLNFNKNFAKTFEKLLKEKRSLESENSKLLSRINDLEIEVKKLANDKEVIEPCKKCEVLTKEVDSLECNVSRLQYEALNFSKFKKSSIVLDDMLSRQKLSQDKEGLGFSKNEKITSIMDSGCTKHMTGNRRLFTSYKAYDSGHVVSGSNLKGKVIGRDSKDDVLEKFKILCKRLENLHDCSIVSIVTNHSSKFDKLQFRSFYEQHGMSYNLSGPFTSQLSEIVERTHRKLRKTSCAMLDEQSIPQKFWCHALDTTTYIFNKSLFEPKSSPSVEDERINGPILQDLNESSLLQVNVSDEGYPKSIKEARGYPTEQVIGELNERTLRSKTKQA
ncbi:retrovirus-related pol polyprotein from transposon TNT 1-94 [Tanacetum coccineum]